MTASELANEYRRQRDELLQALKDAMKVICGICDKECCDYGFGDEIDRLSMISENKKPCRFCDRPEGSRRSHPYCTKHQTFCEPGYYPDCDKETTLYPHHERKPKMNSKQLEVLEKVHDFLGVLIRENLIKDAPFLEEEPSLVVSDLADEVHDAIHKFPERNCDRFGDIPGDAVSDFLKKHPNANFSGTDQHAISVFAGWAFREADKEEPSCR